ncbi:MAG: nucleoside hydrolase [Chloroflexi bacterium]|nr:nucleoside hydrolase [Chloroflexota bacterium]
MSTPPKRTRMILVVDTGVDDALALAFAVRHPRIQLEAALTTWGNVGLDLVNDNTLRVLDWLGATDVPVIAGADRPLDGPAIDAGHFHGQDGLGGAQLRPATRAVLPDAVTYLVDRLTREPGELSVVCTGPFTNLALALRREPRVVDYVREVVVMGGTAQMPGNVTPVAEFNVCADPAAAAIVFDQTWPVTMIGLDVTNQVILSAQDVRGLEGNSSVAAVLTQQVTRSFFERRAMGSIALHDPLAVGVALDPTLVTLERGPVHVETRGQYTRGQTVFDMRLRAARPPSSTRVALGVDAQRFRSLFFTTLGLAI